MALTPFFDTLAVLRSAEVVSIVWSLQPPALTFGFALFAAGSFCAVALMMHIASIRQIELAAMLALPLRRTLHRQTQECESPLLQAQLSNSTKNSAAKEENRIRQNKMKKSSCLKL
jgi:hypothetical protein